MGSPPPGAGLGAWLRGDGLGAWLLRGVGASSSAPASALLRERCLLRLSISRFFSRCCFFFWPAQHGREPSHREPTLARTETGVHAGRMRRTPPPPNPTCARARACAD